MAKAPSTTSSSPIRRQPRGRPHHRQGRQHQHRVPRRQGRRFHLFLQRAGPSTRRHAGAIPRHAAAASADPGRGRHLAELPPKCRRRLASGPANRSASISTTVELEGRLAEGTTFGYWTFNGKRAGSIAARSRRRHRRRAPQEFRRQRDGSLGRFPCGHRAGRRGRVDADQSGRREQRSNSRR